jgi:hypothetical protein
MHGAVDYTYHTRLMTRGKRATFVQIRAREKVQEAVEDALGLPGGLLVEFTALMTWRPGASIGWHYDANRCRHD